MLAMGVEFNSLDGGEHHWFIKGIHQNLIFMNRVLHCRHHDLMAVVDYHLVKSDFQNDSNTQAIQETKGEVNQCNVAF